MQEVITPCGQLGCQLNEEEALRFQKYAILMADSFCRNCGAHECLRCDPDCKRRELTPEIIKLRSVVSALDWEAFCFREPILKEDGFL